MNVFFVYFSNQSKALDDPDNLTKNFDNFILNISDSCQSEWREEERQGAQQILAVKMSI